MELTQLEYFLTVVRLQHVTKASESLSITQPALSHSISKLEEELGMPLFERSGRNIKVSRYGRMFADSVERALLELERGKQVLEEYANPESGVVSLAYLNILGAELVPKLIQGFHELYPKIRFELVQGNHRVISEHMEKGECDLMISSMQMESSDYGWIPLQTVPLYAVFPATHPLAQREEIHISELAGEPYVEVKHHCGLKTTLETCFHRAGFTPASAYEAEDLMTVAGFITAGLGVSILPKTNGLMLDGLVWVPIKDEGSCCEIGLILKNNGYLTAATKRFLEYVKECFR
ncbi:LysR family transcriptional regulator [Paenibacillus nasutitermitis]|uniref:HTH-type transcriptional regulator YybE n=1 Tax=Paenibacillus nasutitermitis TaxID=1652958 RepID=A0A916Z894_9BACL|nr:LysR family transcriptional regulator [Paenibacillus nasutitermitis]GGD81096.1 putative HTH-type transcriptional regulator YybE [Paenibacillus nasutitermitis]